MKNLFLLAFLFVGTTQVKAVGDTPGDATTPGDVTTPGLCIEGQPKGSWGHVFGTTCESIISHVGAECTGHEIKWSYECVCSGSCRSRSKTFEGKTGCTWNEKTLYCSTKQPSKPADPNCARYCRSQSTTSSPSDVDPDAIIN